MSDPIVGIDLGTSNSVVAYCDATGAVRVLSDEAGYKIHPSVVSFHPSGGVVVGAAAKQRKVIDPSNTIYSVKRLLGRTFGSNEVKTAQSRSPFQIKEGANQMPMIVTRGGDFAVPEISAIVLDHVRNLAATALDTEVSRAVVTVPASFNDAQRTATATAGAIAGITVMRVLNEPTAAALAYGHSRNLKSVIAVYDFGGGTFDITLLKLQDEVYEVLGTAGDSFLGGDDLDERIVDKMVNRFLGEHRIDLRTNEVAMMRLRAVAEQTKIELSRRSRAVVRIDEIAYGPKGAALNLQIELTRDEFVTQVSDIIDRTFPVCKDAMKLAGLEPAQIDDIILVGGTTKIPYVRDQVSKFFGKAPRTDVNPEEAVAVGAALQASALERTLQRVSARLPVVDSTQTDYEFGVEEESLTMPQGSKGEPTDPRAKISPQDHAEELRPKKPTSLPMSAETGDDEIEGADTNVSAAPTSTNPNIKKAPERKSGEYSAQSVASDKLDEKAAKAIGKLNSAKQSNIGPMGKVPARKFGEPLPPVTRMEPKVDPRLKKSGAGIGKMQTGPVPTVKPPTTPPPVGVATPASKSTQPFGRPDLGPPGSPVPAKDKIDGREDTAVALAAPQSPAASPHAATMMHDVPETPLPMIPTTPGIGGPTRAPTVMPQDDADGDELVPPPPPKRFPQTFPVVEAPNSVMTQLPDPDDNEYDTPIPDVPLGAAGASDLAPESTQEMPDDFSDLEMGAPGQTMPPLNVKTNPGAKVPTKPLPAPKAPSPPPPNPARTMMGTGNQPPIARPAPPPAAPPAFVPAPTYVPPPPMTTAQPSVAPQAFVPQPYVPPAPPIAPTQAMAPFIPVQTQAMPPGPPPPSPFANTDLPSSGGGLFDELNFPTEPPRPIGNVTGPPPMGGPMAPSPYGPGTAGLPMGGPMGPAPSAPPPAYVPPPPPPVQQQPYVPAPAPYVPPPPAPMAPPPPVAPAPPVRQPVVLDVTPRGLGIGTVAGYCEELIRRNSRLPAQQRKVFTTSRDSQEVVRIVVCQGESRRMDNNAVLGDLVLEGLPPRPRGETSIEVTFTLDASGILQVRARDAQTGTEQRASLDLLGAMPEGDVDAARERLQALRR